VRLGESLGLELVAMANPVIARVPWPMHTRHRVSRGRRVASTRPLLIKPLSKAEVHRLTSRALATPPYAEHYCLPWGWRCWQPYGWTASYGEWAKTLAIVAHRRRSIRGLIPRRVGVMR
jgi:hypothetical protein